MVTREEVFRIIESLECEGIPFNVRAAEVLRQTWAERVEFECQANERPKWDGGFKEARKIVEKLDPLHDIPPFHREMIAEALVEAFDNGVHAENNAWKASRRVDQGED